MSKLLDYINEPLPVEQYLSALFKKDAELVIFDIGACEGEDSIRYSRIFPNSRIFSFEPLKENFDKASRNISQYGSKSISLCSFALSDKNGESEFYVSSGQPEGQTNTEEWNFGNKSSSLLPPGEVTKVFSWLDFKEVRKVTTKTLGSFVEENALTTIDYIHMDVQGAELAVLSGADEFISKIKSIWLEVENRPLYKDQPLRKDVEAFLKAKGFVKLYEEVGATAGDQLYINSRYFDKNDFDFKVNNVKSAAKPRLIDRIKQKIAGDKKIHLHNSYSQSGEDLIVSFIFNAIGVSMPSYIDIGAHHPYRFSNTAIFYERGCTGINIEPDPELFKEFKKERSRDINLNIGVGDTEGNLNFYKLSTSALNTFVKEEAERLCDKFGYSIKEVLNIPVRNLDSVLNEFNKGVFPDFLTIDVEGGDELILKGISDKNGPTVICAETISFEEDGSGVKNTELISLLESKGYMLYADTYINSIFVKRDKWLKK
jgi:FkbM family methyltransferase